MKFALINDKRIKANKGTYPSYGLKLIARCGEIKVHPYI